MRFHITITLLTVLWDATGTRYRRGKGMMLFVDGKQVAARKDLGSLDYSLNESFPKEGKK